MQSLLKLFVDEQRPARKRIFLLDGAGAFVSALSLGTIAGCFAGFFGLPGSVLYLLAAVAGLLAMYSFSCFLWLTAAWRPFLRGVIVANLLYCCLTIGLALFFWRIMTFLGWVYFVCEVAIIIGLVVLEWMTLRKSSANDHALVSASTSE